MDEKRMSELLRKRKFKTKKRLLQKLTNININNSDEDGVQAKVIKQEEEIAENVYREQICVEHAEAAEGDKEVEDEESEGNEEVDVEKNEGEGGEEEEKEEEQEEEDIEDDEEVKYNDPGQVFEENNIQNQGDDEEVIEVTKLRQWVVDCNVPHAHVDKLLAIFRPRLLPSLPACTKSLIRTSSAEYDIEPIEDSDGSMGEFVYIGIETGLKQCIDTNVYYAEVIELLINADGLRLFKSSAKELWPILCRVFFQPMIYELFTVAIYAGNSKPKCLDEYLNKFIEEINNLQQEGLLIDNKLYAIKIKGFVADTPARSFMKATQGHSGFHCCERCCVIGRKKNRTNVFLETTYDKRTDESFRHFRDPEHHTNVTPLLLIQPPVDMIKSFVLDFMHLAQGVMKRLIEYWTIIKDTKLSQWTKNELSRRLIYLRNFIPLADFQRKPMDLQFLAKWKATQYMFILLYAGPIIFKGLLKTEQYNNFLLFHTACRLLCSASNPNMYKEYAQEYLEKFVISAIDPNIR